MDPLLILIQLEIWIQLKILFRNWIIQPFPLEKQKKRGTRGYKLRECVLFSRISY